MRYATFALVFALLAGGASAQVCYNEATQRCYPPIFGGSCSTGDTLVAECPVAQPTPVPTVVPTVVPTPVPTPAPDPSFLDKIKIVLNQGLVLKLLGFFTSMVVFIQALKKALEAIAKWEWLLKLIPQLGVVISFLAHGVGPIILNALLTLAVSAPVVLTDGVVTLREIITLIGLVIGNDVIYRAVRDWLGIFPKGNAA